jgi:hypothetical protein
MIPACGYGLTFQPFCDSFAAGASWFVMPKAAGGLHHHCPKPLGIEPGTLQHGFHHLIGEQIVEARLIAAATVHDPLLPIRL